MMRTVLLLARAGFSGNRHFADPEELDIERVGLAGHLRVAVHKVSP
jgi:hypothetical protein